MTEQENNNRNIKKLKENLITPFCGWGSIGSRLQSHYEKTFNYGFNKKFLKPCPHLK